MFRADFSFPESTHEMLNVQVADFDRCRLQRVMFDCYGRNSLGSIATMVLIRFLLRSDSTRILNKTRPPPEYFPSSNFVKNAFLGESVFAFYITFAAFSRFWKISEFFWYLSFGRQKAFLRNITILSTFYIKFAAFPQFLNISFFFH